jgi:hypothetical protein
MSKSETIRIDEVEYVRKDSLPTIPITVDGVTDHGIQIAVLDRGFVYIGRVKTDKDWCYITDASCIRLWGTTKGLGELVNGPLTNTKLDKAGNVKVNIRSLIHLIACKEPAWNTKL